MCIGNSAAVNLWLGEIGKLLWHLGRSPPPLELPVTLKTPERVPLATNRGCWSGGDEENALFDAAAWARLGLTESRECTETGMKSVARSA